MKFSQWFNEAEQNMEFPNPKAHYLACVLTLKSQKDLYNIVNLKIGELRELQNIPKDWVIACHHMTVNPKPMLEDFELNKPIFGKQVLLDVIGIAANENCCAVIINSPVHSTNDIPHITIAHSRNVVPHYSNELLKLNKVHSMNPYQLDSEFLAIRKDKRGYWPEPTVPMASFSLAPGD